MKLRIKLEENRIDDDIWEQIEKGNLICTNELADKLVSKFIYNMRTEEYLPEDLALHIINKMNNQRKSEFQHNVKVCLMQKILIPDSDPGFEFYSNKIDVRFDTNRIPTNIANFIKQYVDLPKFEKDNYFSFMLARYLVGRSLYDEYAEEYIHDDEVEASVQNMIEDNMFESALRKIYYEMQNTDDSKLKVYEDFLNTLKDE
jgi:hypothetical protein